MKKLLGIVAVTALLVGCGAEVPTIPGADIPDVTGKYSGTWTILQTGPEGQFHVECAGYIAIADQDGRIIQGGSWRVSPEDRCDGLEGSVRGGSVNLEAPITLTLVEPDGERLHVERGACSLERGDREFSGDHMSDSLEVAKHEEWRCDGMRVSTELRFNGGS